MSCLPRLRSPIRPSRTESPMILKLGMQHQGFKFYKVFINGDPGLTVTYFMARSNLVACAFECEKLLQSNLWEKLAANDQINRKITFLKKKIDHRVLCAPATGLYTLFSNIFTISIKALGQSKPNLLWSLLGKGNKSL